MEGIGILIACGGTRIDYLTIISEHIVTH